MLECLTLLYTLLWTHSCVSVCLSVRVGTAAVPGVAEVVRAL